MSIKEDYVSYEVAKLLKEKGFDKFIVYGWDEQVFDKENPRYFSLNFDKKEHWISCPTHQMAMKWLREREKLAYNILIIADGDLGDLYYSYEIQEIDNEFLQVNGSLNIEDQRFDTYEEAVEAALKYALGNLV